MAFPESMEKDGVPFTKGKCHTWQASARLFNQMKSDFSPVEPAGHMVSRLFTTPSGQSTHKIDNLLFKKEKINWHIRCFI
jgi:hypothetical protein